MTVERLEHIAREALLGGYGHVETWRDTGTLRRRVLLPIAMDCEQPYEFELFSRFPARHGMYRPGMTVVIQSRCRKCTPCKERRRMFWAARAVHEWSMAPTNLFGTLTFSPENDAVMDARARLRLSARGVDFDRLDPPDLFRERVKEAGAEVTKWLKRLRHSDRKRKLRFRYLMVAEAHQSGKTSELKRGRPHFHVLLHELDGALVLPAEWAVTNSGEIRCDKNGNPLLADLAFLRTQWQAGFSSFAMCRTPQAASYVCKYLTKEEASVRIRSSFRYGKREAVAKSSRQSGEESWIPPPSEGENK